MKILLTSDWHLDAVTAGVPRLGEFSEYIGKIVQAVRDHGVDTIAILGDYFDPGKMNGPEMTTVLFDTADRLGTSGADRVIWIAGNHDVIESPGGWTTISPLESAIGNGAFHDDCCKCAVQTVFQRPQFMKPREGFGILALPYTARTLDVSDHLSGAIEAAEAYRKEGNPMIVLGHLSVPGAVQGSESKEMARGRDADIPFDSLANLSPALVANGHYHKAQIVKGPGGVEVVIPGSPHRFTFGERNDSEKGFMILDLPEVPCAKI